MEVSIIIPAYNEEEAIGKVITELLTLLGHNRKSFEILVVNDGSTDKTEEVAKRYPCRVISHKTNRGKGAAIRTGIANVKGDKIVFIDADGTYPTESVLKLIELLDRYDAVFTIRDKRNIYFINRIGNRIFNLLAKILCHSYCSDLLSGLYALRKDVVNQIELESDGFMIETEIAIKTANMGVKVTEFPIGYKPRIGKSKLRSFRDGYKILKMILSLIIWYNPLLCFILPGLVLFVASTILTGLTFQGSFKISNISLDFHTLTFGETGILAGFQLIVYGFLMEIYSITHKFKKPSIITKFIRPVFYRFLFLVGTLFFMFGLTKGLFLFNKWAHNGFGNFYETRSVIHSIFFILFGLQMLFSSLIASAFIKELFRIKQDMRP